MFFQGFTEDDFNVFTIEGLEPRMEELIAKVRPKLEALGEHYAAQLTHMTGDEMFPHVAKHARRTVHPPKDTWVAIANNKRGYKKHPHFQIGLWETHVFIWFAIINEAEDKPRLSKKLIANKKVINQEIPEHFVWSVDHTKPETTERLTKEMLKRLGSVKKAELLCGMTFPREQVVAKGSSFTKDIDEVLEKLTSLYGLVTSNPAYQ